MLSSTCLAVAYGEVCLFQQLEDCIEVAWLPCTRLDLLVVLRYRSTTFDDRLFLDAL